MEVDESKDIFMMGTMGQWRSFSHLIWPAKKRPPTALEEPMMHNTQRKVAAFSLEATFSSCQKGKTMAV